MFLAITSLSVSEVLLVALLGMGVVMAALIMILFMTKLLSLFVGAMQKKSEPAMAVASGPVTPVVTKPTPLTAAPAFDASTGELCQFDVDDKTAAMLMAIVADELGTPLSELRFLSMREVPKSGKK